MKKKILISVVACLLVGIIAFVINMHNTNSTPEPVKIETPVNISYYADDTKSEKFTITLPQEHSGKIFTSIDEPAKNVVRYTFKHIDSGELLFVITVCKGDVYKTLTYPYEILKESKNYTYLWSYTNTNNVKIEDSAIAENFKTITRYIPTIKSMFTVEQTTSDEQSVVSVTNTTKTTIEK